MMTAYKKPIFKNARRYDHTLAFNKKKTEAFAEDWLALWEVNSLCKFWETADVSQRRSNESIS